MSPTEDDAPDRPRAGAMLALWVAAIVGLQGAWWLSGLRGSALAEAVERGAARAEALGSGEVGEEVVRKAIRTQRETLPFWTTLALLGDFACEPAALVARATAAAVLLAGLAALSGRPVGFAASLSANAAAQGLWVLGLATRLALGLALRTDAVATSAVLFLPAGPHPAPLWVALRQLDAFALLGWAVMARGSWRRGQANLLVAATAGLLLAAGEAALRIATLLAIQAGMRLTILPD